MENIRKFWLPIQILDWSLFQHLVVRKLPYPLYLRGSRWGWRVPPTPWHASFSKKGGDAWYFDEKLLYQTYPWICRHDGIELSTRIILVDWCEFGCALETSDDVLMRDVLDVPSLVATEESSSIYYDITFKAVWSLCPRHNKLSNNTHILDRYS